MKVSELIERLSIYHGDMNIRLLLGIKQLDGSIVSTSHYPITNVFPYSDGQIYLQAIEREMIDSAGIFSLKTGIKL